MGRQSNLPASKLNTFVIAMAVRKPHEGPIRRSYSTLRSPTRRSLQLLKTVLNVRDVWICLIATSRPSQAYELPSHGLIGSGLGDSGNGANILSSWDRRQYLAEL